MSSRPTPPQQGDEEELFQRYADRLRRVTQVSVNTTREIVDDACAFAWMKLITNQPRRETVFAWLRTVARNEAIRLDGIARGISSIDTGPAPTETAATRNRVETTQAMLELRERLEELPAREREVVLLQAAGWRYQELAEFLDVSDTRINQLLARASARMREMDIRDHDVTSPRARRLRELEDDPPTYIVASIGVAPPANPKLGGEDVRREWKRIALQIEDFRSAHGVTDRVMPLGPRGDAEAAQPLAKLIADFRRRRGLSVELER